MASDDKLNIPLEKRIDSDGRAFYIAKLSAPITINAENGVAFLVFISSEGEETLQISSITKPKKYNKE